MKKPVGEYVLVRPVEEQMMGSFYIPNTSKEKTPKRGTVVAIGDSIEFECKVGDDILFARQDFIPDDEGNIIVPYRDIHYVFETL